MTVYVTQEPKPSYKNDWVPDLSSALEYGKIKFIFEADYNTTSSPSNSMRKAEYVLQSFDPENDYILFVPGRGEYPGMITSFVIKGLSMDQGFDYINILVYDRRIGEDGNRHRSGGVYIPKRWPLEEESYNV